MASSTVRAAVYLRVSIDKNMDGLAIDRQRNDCLKIAAKRGWTVVDEYIDQSKSATDETKVRPAYDRLVADFHSGMFDSIICWDLDWLTRQPRQIEHWIDAAEDRSLQLVTANGEANLSTDGGWIYARIKAEVARTEVEHKAARQSRAAIRASRRAASSRNGRIVTASSAALIGRCSPMPISPTSPITTPCARAVDNNRGPRCTRPAPVCPARPLSGSG